MRRFPVLFLLACSCLVLALTGCTRDPNVRKQKYFASGENYFARGKYREASIQYANAIQLDNHFAQAHYQLAQTYLKLRDWNRAYSELERTVEVAPDYYQAHVDLANLLISARNLKDAQPHLDILRDRQPNTPDTHEAWANLYAAQNNFPAAIAEMQKGIDSDPGRSESYLNLALLQLRSNQPDQAESNFRKATELAPKAVNTQLALGSFYQSRNRLGEAEQQYHRAIDADPGDATPRAALVRLLMIEGKKSEAETFLKQTKRDFADNPEGYRMLGDFYFASGEMDAALAEYASLHSEHPKDLVATKNYVQILILKNRLDDAAKYNDEILKNNAHDIEALVYRGEIQLHGGDATAAAESLQGALQNDPDNAIAHYQLGLAFDQEHNEERAEAEWRQAVRLRPDLSDAQRALATLELSRGDINGLMQTAQQIIDAQPTAPDGFLWRAAADIHRQRFTDADQDIRKAMDVAPQAPLPYVQMGNLRLLQKQFPDAIKSFQLALDRDPGSAAALQGLMNCYLSQKQPDQAVAAAQAQIAKSPNNSNFYDLLGSALVNGKKDLKSAEVAFRKAVDLDKNNPDALQKLAHVQVMEGSGDQALATYLQSIKDNPREPNFYIRAGELYEIQGKFDDARNMYQQAVNVQPDNPIAANDLAYLVLQQGGNVDVALSMAQTARRGLPDWPAAADTLGWAYYQKGVYQSAIDLFLEAIRLNEKAGNPSQADFHYHLGLAYQHANQNALARQQLERVLKINPNYSDAAQVRKALAELHG